MASYAKTYKKLENMVSYFSLQKHSLKENGLIKNMAAYGTNQKQIVKNNNFIWNTIQTIRKSVVP